MMMRRACFAAFAVGLGGGVATADIELSPGYQSICGYPVRYAATPSVSQAVLDEDGNPLILMDPVLRADTEQDRRRFLLFHECAHHRMGHVSPEAISRRRTTPTYVRDTELSADCWAAETLARLGQESAIHTMIQRFFRAGPYSPGTGYPAGIQRSFMIQQCAKVGRKLRRGATLESTPSQP